MSAGWLMIRVVLGGLMAAHGSQKLFAWFGGYGLDGTGGYFEQLGFRPGRLFAGAAGLAEFLGGLLVLVGLGGPIGPALVLSVMIVAVVTVHRGHGLFAATNGIEVPALYGAGVIGVALAGHGAYSLDAAFGLASAWTPQLAVAALAVGVVGALVALAARQPAVSSHAHA